MREKRTQQDAEENANGGNILGVALSSLMKSSPGRKVPLLVKALERVVESKLNDWQKWLLCDCLLAYSALTDSQRIELGQIMTNETNKSTFKYTPTWYDKGHEQGIEQGIEQGLVQGEHQGILRMLQEQIEERFGALSEVSLKRLRAMSTEELNSLGRKLMTVSSLAALGLEPH